MNTKNGMNDHTISSMFDSLKVKVSCVLFLLYIICQNNLGISQSLLAVFQS